MATVKIYKIDEWYLLGRILVRGLIIKPMEETGSRQLGEVTYRVKSILSMFLLPNEEFTVLIQEV